MSNEKQIKIMRLEIIGDSTDSSKDEIFVIKLGDAKNVALNTLYPYDKTKTELPLNDGRLENWQTRCAIELYKRIGTTNVSHYGENGIDVDYLTGLISKELMNELIPKAGVPK